MTIFVLDNSVTMRRFFDSGSHPYADAILNRLTTLGDEAIAPAIWPYEVSAVLSRAVTKNGIDAENAADFLDDLKKAPSEKPLSFRVCQYLGGYPNGWISHLRIEASMT